MTFLQASIGALNDVVDAPADAGHKPGKPIPAGIVALETARAVALAAAVVGLALAAPSGMWLLGLALVVLLIGGAYDLVAKGTPWSWVPLAVGIPILPLYGWLGAAGTLPGWMLALLPIAAVAGASLAIANARVDLERDLASGRASVATAIGLKASSWVGSILAATAVGLAVTWLQVGGVGISVASSAAMAAGGLLIALGLGIGHRAAPGTRERAWAVQAIGMAAFGIGWVAAVAT